MDKYGPPPPGSASSNMEKYEVKEQVGKGSFGSAFLVIHKETKQRYVVKKVRLARQTENQRKASHREMELVQALSHPYIVECHDAWVERGHTICVVYGYCEAGDLSTYLQRKHKNKQLLSEAQVQKWYAQLLLGIEYLHSRNILHRDLKSSNVFLTSSGDVRIGDFGLAKVLGEGDLARSMVGTPNYMCPELLSEKPYGLKSDIWALGCILYEMTALRPAFTAFNMQGLVQKIKKVQISPLPSGYSKEWNETIKALLRRLPEERPSAQELTEARFLQKALRENREHAKVLLGELSPPDPPEPLDPESFSPPAQLPRKSLDEGKAGAKQKKAAPKPGDKSHPLAQQLYSSPRKPDAARSSAASSSKPRASTQRGAKSAHESEMEGTTAVDQAEDDMEFEEFAACGDRKSEGLSEAMHVDVDMRVDADGGRHVALGRVDVTLRVDANGSRQATPEYVDVDKHVDADWVMLR
ncbi:hypothetical protein CYMTET_53047 [Cymbomonas tetramitiformis]|uniref:non-specific serine/threonine protein kinase n=1 Tax=Cymbomonas tetramitiformis TaxID=36881 RepID=A0AAE0BJ43_9CHLO|nr:hypothetical protein CYMTET_53047 [Cymbomonas tetramitiformis]